MNKFKELQKNKVFKITTTILKVLCYAILILFIIVVFLQRTSGNKWSFFNFRMFTVVSKSMEPDYTVGDVLISKDIAASKIKVGDDISYLGKKGDVKDKIVTHRVTKIVKEADGKYLFYAQGLSNIIEDPVIEEEQVYGIVVYKPKTLSLVYKIVGTHIGFYLCIFVPLMFIIGSEIIHILLDREEKRREKLK